VAPSFHLGGQAGSPAAPTAPVRRATWVQHTINVMVEDLDEVYARRDR
jgi:hypothetical protein